MKSLQELARAVTKYRLDNVAAFNLYNRKDKNSLYNRFLDGVLNEEFTTDAEAAQSLYGEGTDSVKYRVLKNRLKHRIYNNLLFIYSGKRSASSYYDVWLSLYRQLVVAKFLFGISARNAGQELMLKVLDKAVQYELHDIVQQCAMLLRRQSMLNGDIKKFEEYNDLLQKANDLLMAELEAEKLHYTVLINFSKSQALTPELISLSQSCSERITELSKNYQTYLIRYYENGTQSIYYQLIYDYRSALASCERFETYLLENKIFYSATRLAHVLVTKIGCYLHLKEYEQGIKTVQQVLKLYKSGSENHFSVQELYFLLVLNSNDLNKATDIYLEVVSHDAFSDLRPQLQESWKIFGGYLWFMLQYQRNEACLKRLSEHKQNFRISKLLNEIPLYSKDKKGMNVAVLILQVLLLLAQKDYVRIISRTEALKSYIYRNLGKDDAYRSHFFIKMLLAMEKAQFDYDKTVQRTEALLDQMKQGSLSYNSTQTRMEIVPYERLWDAALQMIREG